jgi:hypothetical protein
MRLFDIEDYENAKEGGELLPWQIAIEVKDIVVIRDEYGRAVRDLIHEHFGKGLKAVMPGSAWRLYQYEHVAQAQDQPDAHRGMGRLEQWLWHRPLVVACPDGSRGHLRIGFVYGMGQTFHEAYQAIRAEKEGGRLGVQKILNLPDGSVLQVPGNAPAQVELCHPDEELRNRRELHRWSTNRGRGGYRVCRTLSDGSSYELSPDEVDVYFEKLKIERSLLGRWLVPWRLSWVDTAPPS